ncbi:MAG: acetyltransferase [Deltaproteobacteria bacterium]|nr:acetyltransferase [Deltaproteobacteria bacterium]
MSLGGERPPLTVIGAGGHAKVVIATARAAGWEIAGVVDDDPKLWATQLLEALVTGPCEEALRDPARTCVLAIGSNATRRRLAALARCRFASVVHPSATVHASVVLGAGTVVFAQAAIQPDTRIGAHGIVNTAASIDHDCTLGEAVHVAPGARLAGGVTLGDEVFIGIGAVVIPNIAIGARTTIGAGAAVVRPLPADVIAVGVPAEPRR